MPKVSVIIPVYNAEKYLPECLDSILGQSLQDMEVLCVDAGSTDASLPILTGYAQQDHRVRVLSSNGRMDAGSARNLGLDQAAGEYLAFLDADDFFHPDMLEEAYEKAKAEDSDIVVFSARQLDMQTGQISPMPWSLELRNCPKHSPFSPEEMAGYLFNSFQNWTWNKLFKGELIRRHHIRFQAIARTNDMAFTCQALALARRISVLPKVYATYRVGTFTSLQQTNDQSPTCFWEAYKHTRDRLVAAGVYERYQQSFLNAVLSGTLYNLRSVKSDAAFREILRLIQQESQEFGFDSHGPSYFYNRFDYKKYRKYQTGQETRRPSAAPKNGLTGLLTCIEDHGFVYTVKYAVQKILRKLTKS